jgi:MFS family permease
MKSFSQKSICYILIGLVQFGGALVYATYFLYLTNDLGLSNTKAVFLSTPIFIATLVFELPTGLFADKYGYKRSFLASIIFAIIFSLIYFFSPNYILLIIGSCFFGLSNAFFSGAFEALCIEHFEKDLKRFYTNRQIILDIASIGAPILGFYLASKSNYGISYFIYLLLNIIIVFIGAIFLKEIKDESVKHIKGTVELLIQSKKTIKELILSNNFLRLQMFNVILWGVSSVAIDNYWLKMPGESLKESQMGFLLSGVYAASVLSSLFLKQINNIKLNYWLSFLVNSLAVLFAGIFVGTKLVVILILIKSFSLNIHNISYYSILNRIVTKQKATIRSLLNLFYMGGNLLGTLVMGILADKYSYGFTWIIAGVIYLIIAFSAFKQSKYIDLD